MSGTVVPCVGAIVIDERGRLLLVKRGHEPGAGLWSVPGGRVEAGETDAEALVRELREETGLTVSQGKLAGRVTRPGGPGTVLDIRDYFATVADDRGTGSLGADSLGAGSPVAGDDAAEVRWVAPADMHELPLTDGLAEALTAWGVLS
jgi:8-oxo-dGTP diphosphatase